MHNKVKFIIFLSYFASLNVCFGANYNFDEIESFVGRTMENMEKASMETIESAKKQLEELKKHMAKELQQTEQSIKGFTDQINLKVGLDVLDEKDGVHVIVKLPKKTQQSNAVDKKIELEAKGNSLDGTLNYNGITVKIAIADGQVAQISYKYSIQDEKKDANGKSFKHVSSVSTQSIVLPTPVDNLENTKAEFRDGKLILILPKKQAVARGWRRIEVK
jgi:HSP20 family molecular chaperone IbpA